MIRNIYIYKAQGVDPYHNIATEKYLLEKGQPSSCILYLWQNAHTVVIGRNQNAWAECRTSQLEQEGGHLARRLSGGGAVYHDLGNLNFTFLMDEADYDVDKQLSVIQTACATLGIQAVKSGRNDLLAEGCKFSGNAFYHRQGRAYHHGTLLVDADIEKLGRYLTPPKAKLEAKGVASVRSRVTNLKSLCPALTCETLADALVDAFGKVYGLVPQALTLEEAAQGQIREDEKTLSTWQWLYGRQLPFTFSCEEKFDWGHIRLQLQVESGTILHAEVYSDAMDWLLPERIATALTGCRFVASDLEKVLSGDPVHTDILSLLKKNI